MVAGGLVPQQKGKGGVKKIEKSYKFRMYPNKEQQKQISITFSHCRYVYNYFLAQRISVYKEAGKSISQYEQSRELTKMRKKDGTKWLTEADRSAYTYALRDLDTAYQNFFRGLKAGRRVGFPKFKSKKSNRFSYTTQFVNNNIKILDNRIQLPKLGLVKCRISKQIEGRILSATVSKNPSGKYFVSICCTDVKAEPLPKTDKTVGIDLGIKHLAVDSNGIEYTNNKYLAKSEKKLARLQRQLSRKPSGSKRYKKARIKVARLHEYITNQRKDQLHKLTTQLVRENDIICIEDLNVAGMVRNHHLAKAISDVGMGEFRRQLQYKCNWYSKTLVEIDRFYPSSQICSCCSYQNRDVKDLSVREWTCPNCGAHHDRDVNAAKNILAEGLTKIA